MEPKSTDDAYKNNQPDIIYDLVIEEKYSKIQALFDAKANIDWESNLLFKRTDVCRGQRFNSFECTLINFKPDNALLLFKISKHYIDPQKDYAYDYWRRAYMFLKKPFIYSELEKVTEIARKKIIAELNVVLPVTDLVNIVDSYLHAPKLKR